MWILRVAVMIQSSWLVGIEGLSSVHSPRCPHGTRNRRANLFGEVDIAAFKEALKSLNQFNQKTQERINDENNLRGQLAIMLGSEMKGWQPRKTETDEDEPAPEPLDLRLFQLARELERDLTQDLADTVVGAEKSPEFGEVAYKYREGVSQSSRFQKC